MVFSQKQDVVSETESTRRWDWMAPNGNFPLKVIHTIAETIKRFRTEKP